MLLRKVMQRFWEPDTLNEVFRELNEELKGEDIVLSAEKEKKGKKETESIFRKALTSIIETKAEETSASSSHILKENIKIHEKKNKMGNFLRFCPFTGTILHNKVIYFMIRGIVL